MGYETAGEDVDNLLKQLDEDERKGIQLSPEVKNLRKKIRDHLKNPR